MKFDRRTLAKLAVGLLGATVLGFSPALAQDKPAPFDKPGQVKIALVRYLSTGDFFQAYLAGVQSQAKALGVDLRVLDSKQDAALQADMVDQAIALGVNGIIIQHGLTESMKDAAQRAVDAGIKVVAFDVNVETPKTIRNMLEGGVTDPNSPANKLTDKSYANFVTAFNFVQYGDTTTSRDAVQKDTLKLFSTKSSLGMIKPGSDYIAAETAYYNANVVKLTSIDDLMANQRLLNYALSAYGLDPSTQTPATVRKMLEGGITDPNSPANKSGSKAYVAFVTAFNFAQYGEKATTRTLAQQPSTDKYVRQTLEEDAGKTNDGVRLALYFQRKAPTLTNWYEVLADKALSQVVRTAFGLPDSFAKADIDKQVQLFQQKFNIKDFANPQKLGKFIGRFTTMYEMNNPSSPQISAASVLFAQPTTAGISTDLLLTMQRMKF